MMAVSLKNMCFVVWNNEVEGRLDSYYHKPEFRDLEDKISKLNCKKIQDISFDLKNGSTPSGGVFEESGIPYFRSQDFNLFDFKINQFITKKFHEKLNRSAIKPSDVLLAVVGATLGVVGYVPENIKEGNVNQNIVRIRVKDKSVNNKYLAIVLASDIGQKLILRNATITTQAYLNNSQLGNIKIPIPPLKIQNQIVELTQSAYKQKVEKEQVAEKLLNSIDDYVLDELVIKIPETKDKMCFAIDSNEVENKRINTFYYQPKFKEAEKSLKESKNKVEPFKNYITKIHYGASLKNIYVDKGIPLLRIQNLRPNRLSLEDIVNLPEIMRKEVGNAFVNEGDILISRSGSVGIVAVVPKEANGFAFGSFMIKFCVNDKINKDFVSIWLNNKIAKLFTQREKIGAIQGNITISTIENFKIPTPPLEIQSKIVNEVKNKIINAEKLKSEAKNIIENAKKEVEKIILGK